MDSTRPNDWWTDLWMNLWYVMLRMHYQFLMLSLNDLSRVWSTDVDVPENSSAVTVHPLSLENNIGVVNDILNQNNVTSLEGDTGHVSVTATQHGCCLTLSDHDRLRIFIHEFVVQGLIPWAERMLRTLSEQVGCSAISRLPRRRWYIYS